MYQATRYNASISFAATLSNGSIVAAAAGPQDHSTGRPTTMDSMYPSGSVTKTFSAVAAMRLVEQGKLELDAKVHTVVDPWLQAQGKPSLRELWDGNAEVNDVTVRHLLQMRSGMADYDDAANRADQFAHPTKDIVPDMFVSQASKDFLFAPGAGGSYTGIGYVVLGWVLCAASGAKTWTDLDLKALAVPPAVATRMPRTIFMGTGPCSQHAGVVHQYCYQPHATAADQVAKKLLVEADDTPLPLPARRHEAELRAPFGDESTLPTHCTAHSSQTWFENVAFNDTVIAERHTSSGGADACCAAADGVSGASLWTFIPSGSSGGGTCRFVYYERSHTQHYAAAGATSGRTDPTLDLSDFLDLYGMSCLNGWTMGNIATTPSEVTSFYHALFAEGAILSQASLAQMKAFLPLTTGFASGIGYGFGLMERPMSLSLRNVHSCGTLPACQCEFRRCALVTHGYGHAGLDYGSGMPQIGFLPELNISYSVAYNVGESPIGMNATMGLYENFGMASQTFLCQVLDAAIHAQLPDYPQFEC